MSDRIVVLSGAGVSAESGLATFRDSGGLWEGYDINEVASIDGWNRDQKRVLDFYNLRRRQIESAEPNSAHLKIADLESYFDVHVVTQNIDDLHERAGSTQITHLHGQITKARSIDNEEIVQEIGYQDLNPGDTAKDGSQLRPHIVWFGEPVPMIEIAAELVASADILIVVGTSLVVYPAAGLIDYARPEALKYVVDPGKPQLRYPDAWTHIEEKAVQGMNELTEKLIKNG